MNQCVRWINDASTAAIDVTDMRRLGDAVVELHGLLKQL
jgi:hypothetical protein